MEALMRIEEDEKLKEMLAERKHRLNANFVWTPENKQKIIELNNGLLERYREAYNELVRITNEFEERYRAGDNNYKDYTIDVEFWYNAPETDNEEENDLQSNLCEETNFWGPSLSSRSYNRDKGLMIEPFEKSMFIDEQSWNENPFNVKELDDTYIYYFMHDIFDHNDTYSLEDAVKMKAENFSWQLVICLEHWGKSCQK
jgi:hypothetical protein